MTTLTCDYCSGPIVWSGRTRRPRWCSQPCRWRAARAGKSGPLTTAPRRAPEQAPRRSHRWRADAACLDHDPEWWFPSGDHGGGDYSRARAVCLGCPVVSECLADALAVESGSGLWLLHGMRGGLTPRQRAQVLKERTS